MPIPQEWSSAEIASFHQLYALRAQLAGFAARTAAARVGAGASTEPLQNCYHEMWACARRNDFAAFLEADMNFHRAVAELASTPALPVIWRTLEHEFRPFAQWAQRALFHDLEMIAAAHEPQLETIRHADAAGAERAAQVDLDALWQMLTEQPAEASGLPDPVERACAYVILNLHRPLRLKDVARTVVHLSESHLAKLFRDSRGESFSAYVQTLRLRRAEDLLRSTNLPIGDIVQRVGYNDTSRFALHFRRAYGVSPSGCRALAQTKAKHVKNP